MEKIIIEIPDDVHEELTKTIGKTYPLCLKVLFFGNKLENEKDSKFKKWYQKEGMKCASEMMRSFPDILDSVVENME